MAEPRIDAEEPPAEAEAVRRRRRWHRQLAKTATALLLSLFLLVAIGMVLLDTGAGHRFIADRIAAQAPDSGLRIRIGRIEGSIWGRRRFRDVRLYDPQGLFAESSRIDLDWQPLGWITNRLIIHDLASELVLLHRLPKLRPSDEPKPVLPGFDISIGRFDIAQLRIGASVTDRPRTATSSASSARPRRISASPVRLPIRSRPVTR